MYQIERTSKLQRAITLAETLTNLALLAPGEYMSFSPDKMLRSQVQRLSYRANQSNPICQFKMIPFHGEFRIYRTH